jgi:hypothetical protein
MRVKLPQDLDPLLASGLDSMNSGGLGDFPSDTIGDILAESHGRPKIANIRQKYVYLASLT